MTSHCPFCGNIGQIHHELGDETCNQSWWGRCIDIECQAETIRFYGSNSWFTKPDEDREAKARATAAWERRA